MEKEAENVWYGWIMCPQIYMLKPCAQPWNITIFADVALTWWLSQKEAFSMGPSPIFTRGIWTHKEIPGYTHREKATWGQREDAVCEPRREPQEKWADNLISAPQPPDLWGNKFLLFKPPSLSYLFWQPSLTQTDCSDAGDSAKSLRHLLRGTGSLEIPKVKEGGHSL